MAAERVEFLALAAQCECVLKHVAQSRVRRAEHDEFNVRAERRGGASHDWPGSLGPDIRAGRHEFAGPDGLLQKSSSRT